MRGKKLVNFIVKIIEDKKGEDIVVANVKKMTSVTDYFIVCTASVREHGRAIHDEIKLELKKKEQLPFAEEGVETGDWIVMDYGDVIVHIMLPEKREFYSLERMWQEIKPSISKSKRT